jgi:Transglycosylase SLT domain
MVNVPAQYDPLLKEMSSATGIPYSVVAAQANAESSFNAKAVSSAGAQGWLQFLPTTYNTYAAQAGVTPGSEFDPASEAKVYDVFMKALLNQEGGSLRDALAAYNAGPNNKAAGYGYADSILSASGQGNITVTSSPSTTTAGFNPLNPLGISVGGLVQSAVNTVLGMLGIKAGLKDMFERFGLIILGFVLVIVGIHILSGGSGSQPINITTSSTEGPEGSTTKRKIKTPVSEHTTTKAAGTGKAVGASEAMEAAAVA